MEARGSCIFTLSSLKLVKTRNSDNVYFVEVIVIHVFVLLMLILCSILEIFNNLQNNLKLYKKISYIF